MPATPSQKPSPSGSVLDFYPQACPPRALLDPTVPCPNPWLTPPQQNPLSTYQAPPPIVRQNQAPAAQFLIFSPPSRAARSCGPIPSTPAYPTSTAPPLHISKPHHPSFTRTEPHRLGFHFFSLLFTYSCIGLYI
jgi:hypothetical protein